MSSGTALKKLITSLFEDSDTVLPKIGMAAGRTEPVREWLMEYGPLIIVLLLFLAAITAIIAWLANTGGLTVRRQILLVTGSFLLVGAVAENVAVVVIAFFAYVVLNWLHAIEYKINRLLDEHGLVVSPHEIKKDKN